MDSAMHMVIKKAEILIEALPYMQEFAGKTVVIKYGGNAMINTELKNAVMDDVILLKCIGLNPILIHGGGPEITEMLGHLQMESRFVNGLRVTDERTMEIAQMVLVGKTNKEIVSMLNMKGARAIGFCGIDGRLIECEKLNAGGGADRDSGGADNGGAGTGEADTVGGGAFTDPGSDSGDSSGTGGRGDDSSDSGSPEDMVDLGYVGKITRINSKMLELVSKDEYIPVIAPIGTGACGHSFNINADTVAAEIAGALKAEKLILLTDVEGVKASPEDAEAIPVLTEAQAFELIRSKVISQGMIPKTLSCLDALDAGVSRATIIDGRVPHCILLEIFTKRGIGTMFVK